MSVRYRCSACGNLTRFDVVSTRRTRAYHHFTVGGDLSVEDEVLLDEVIDSVTCRWCGASDDRIERQVAGPQVAGPQVAGPEVAADADPG